MKRIMLVPAWAAVTLLAVAPAQAQFGGLLRKVTTPTPAPTSSESDNGGCPKGKKGSSVGRGILGGVIRDAVGDAASKAGVYSYVPIAEVSGTLTDAIACRLDPAEQVQAAKATEEVTRGSSTVASINEEGSGREGMTVNDFVIVDGEETRVSKRMCKGPGDTRYVLAA